MQSYELELWGTEEMEMEMDNRGLWFLVLHTQFLLGHWQGYKGGEGEHPLGCLCGDFF